MKNEEARVEKLRRDGRAGDAEASVLNRADGNCRGPKAVRTGGGADWSVVQQSVPGGAHGSEGADGSEGVPCGGHGGESVPSARAAPRANDPGEAGGVPILGGAPPPPPPLGCGRGPLPRHLLGSDGLARIDLVQRARSWPGSCGSGGQSVVCACPLCGGYLWPGPAEHLARLHPACLPAA